MGINEAVAEALRAGTQTAEVLQQLCEYAVDTNRRLAQTRLALLELMQHLVRQEAIGPEVVDSVAQALHAEPPATSTDPIADAGTQLAQILARLQQPPTPG